MFEYSRWEWFRGESFDVVERGEDGFKCVSELISREGFWFWFSRGGVGFGSSLFRIVGGNV